ncbi:MAG: hypothetical protein KGJ90_04870 [Patescibacteria group bacterium]|nr:hypothetical protein [Patescibacteria group bacterium]
MTLQELEQSVLRLNQALLSPVAKKKASTPIEKYDVANKGYVDSRVGIEGRSHNPATTSIPINNNGSLINIDLQTNDFANGITWNSTFHYFSVVTAGRYLVHLSVGFGSEPITGGTSQFAAIKQNGTEVSRGYTLNNGVSGEVETAHVTDILNCAAGDYIEFFAGHLSNATVSIQTGSNLTFATISIA